MTIKIQGANYDTEIANKFLYDDYRLYLKIQWLTYETIDFYIKYINRFIINSEFEKLDIFKSELRIKVSYNKLFHKENKNSTYDKYRQSIIKYYNFLKELEYVNINYWKTLLRVKKESSIPSSLNESDIEIILNYIINNYKIDFYRYRAYFIFYTLLNTWLRRWELASLKKENIYKDYIKVIKWKWRKDRIIYISKKFSKEINEYLEIQDKNNEYVFTLPNWEQITKDWITRVVSQLQKWTGIKIHPHLIRHTYASLCIKRGINIYTLQQQMWHSDLKTTSIYLYMNSRENWEEIQKLNI